MIYGVSQSFMDSSILKIINPFFQNVATQLTLNEKSPMILSMDYGIKKAGFAAFHLNNDPFPIALETYFWKHPFGHELWQNLLQKWSVVFKKSNNEPQESTDFLNRFLDLVNVYNQHTLMNQWRLDFFNHPVILSHLTELATAIEALFLTHFSLVIPSHNISSHKKSFHNPLSEYSCVLVIGIPMGEGDFLSLQTWLCLEMGLFLKKQLAWLKIIGQDEYLSTQSAKWAKDHIHFLSGHRNLSFEKKTKIKHQNIKKSENIDSICALEILQNFLNEKCVIEFL
jgi:RNase H-fold protein (predicted Holliday junction resolvase)